MRSSPRSSARVHVAFRAAAAAAPGAKRQPRAGVAVSRTGVNERSEAEQRGRQVIPEARTSHRAAAGHRDGQPVGRRREEGGNVRARPERRRDSAPLPVHAPVQRTSFSPGRGVAVSAAADPCSRSSCSGHCTEARGRRRRPSRAPHTSARAASGRRYARATASPGCPIQPPACAVVVVVPGVENLGRKGSPPVAGYMRSCSLSQAWPIESPGAVVGRARGDGTEGVQELVRRDDGGRDAAARLVVDDSHAEAGRGLALQETHPAPKRGYLVPSKRARSPGASPSRPRSA